MYPFPKQMGNTCFGNRVPPVVPMSPPPPSASPPLSSLPSYPPEPFIPSSACSSAPSRIQLPPPLPISSSSHEPSSATSSDIYPTASSFRSYVQALTSYSVVLPYPTQSSIYTITPSGRSSPALYLSNIHPHEVPLSHDEDHRLAFATGVIGAEILSNI